MPFRAMHLIPLAQLLGVCPSNQLIAPHRRERQRLLDQSLKQQSTRAGGAAVESKREFVQIIDGAASKVNEGTET